MACPTFTFGRKTIFYKTKFLTVGWVRWFLGASFIYFSINASKKAFNNECRYDLNRFIHKHLLVFQPGGKLFSARKEQVCSSLEATRNTAGINKI